VWRCEHGSITVMSPVTREREHNPMYWAGDPRKRKGRTSFTWCKIELWHSLSQDAVKARIIKEFTKGLATFLEA